MFKRSFLAAAVVVLMAFATAGPSLAGYRMCNHAGQRVDVAFGYPHAQFGWTSEGWWTIQPGRCRTIMRGDLTNRYYYFYATGSEGAVWQGADSQEGGFFCVQTERFVFQNRNFMADGQLNCERRNLQSKRFVVVDTQGAPNHIHNLRR